MINIPFNPPNRTTITSPNKKHRRIISPNPNNQLRGQSIRNSECPSGSTNISKRKRITKTSVSNSSSSTSSSSHVPNLPSIFIDQPPISSPSQSLANRNSPNIDHDNIDNAETVLNNLTIAKQKLSILEIQRLSQAQPIIFDQFDEALNDVVTFFINSVDGDVIMGENGVNGNNDNGSVQNGEISSPTPPPSPPSPSQPTPPRYIRRKFKDGCPVCNAMPSGGRPPNYCWSSPSPKKTALLTVTPSDIATASERLTKKASYIQFTIQRLRHADQDEQDFPPNAEYCTNRQKRLIIYYKIFLDFWEDEVREDKTVWELLSLCIVNDVRKMYPDDAADIEIARQEYLIQHPEEIVDNGVDYQNQYSLDYNFFPFLDDANYE